jgi:hypothetical protein
MMNTMELHWVPRSTNGLADRISNEGFNKLGPEQNTTLINIMEGQFRIDCIQLATKDCDDSLCKEAHIEEGRYEGTRKDMNAQYSTTNYNA